MTTIIHSSQAVIKSNSDGQSLLLLCRALLCMCHNQRCGRKTVFQQPIPTTIIPFPPAQKGSAHQVTNELMLLTSFSEAGLSFPDQYLKLKSPSVCQPSLLLYHFAAQTCAAPGPATPWALKFLIWQTRQHGSSPGTAPFD